ncbi:inter-alpha-trypsin inhibitor heavy chain H5 [Lissotriton helveticus]
MAAIALFCLFLHLPLLSGSQEPEALLEDLDQPVLRQDHVNLRISRQAPFLQRRETKPQVSDLTVKSTIISRYAFTAVSCTMMNRASEPKEAVFQMLVPAAAFISNFTMIIGGQTYYSEVAWKPKVSGDTDDSKNSNGNNERGDNGMETFRATATIPGRMKGIFLLAYEELLQRRLGKYEHTISVRPQNLVGRLLVEVYVQEHTGITDLEVPPLQNNKQKSKSIDKSSPPPSTIIKQTHNSVKVTFNPNVVQQAKIAQNGILGDFVVRYDVNRELSVGDIKVLNGFFVHFFAPKDLPPLPKNVVFVIDTSASMVGTKMKQTKDALFTILQDLRSDDHFNIIGFSNRIRVWQHNRLVQVTPNNIRDAKKFIYTLSPNGGTNINGAIQTGAKLLSDYITQHGRHERSVSLIIFLTDGRPTVGVTQTSSILGSTKNAIHNKFCLFSIGIGFDVDYKLLEKMSLENCGMMRRIQVEEDAAAQLKGFYDEIGTPLLSDIRIEYPEAAVEDVTQNLFPNYFNGSEIVVAGKIVDKSRESLHVGITASNSNKYVILETDVPISQPENGMKKDSVDADSGTKDSEHVERIWGYLTLKELLSSWLKSNDVKEKVDLMEKARKLALRFNFVTPFTRLKVKDIEYQADNPRNDSASLSTEGIGEGLMDLQGQKTKTGSAYKNQDKERTIVSKTSADGDPHFVVDFPLSKIAVCFNIDGEPGDILRLVSDYKDSGVTVNGKLIGAPAPPNGHKKHRTYFSSITIIINKPFRSYVEITPAKVILDSKDRLILSCQKSATVESEGLRVSVSANSNVTITIQGTISFVILVHQYKNPAPFQKNHLGFYISNSKGLSPKSHGLLGQFLYSEVKITEVSLSPGSNPADKNLTNRIQSLASVPSSSALLKVRDRTVPVVWKQRKILNGQQEVDCWFAKNNAAKLIDGTYQDYLVSHPFDTGINSEMMN